MPNTSGWRSPLEAHMHIRDVAFVEKLFVYPGISCLGCVRVGNITEPRAPLGSGCVTPRWL